jgi:hypothetical protein
MWHSILGLIVSTAAAAAGPADFLLDPTAVRQWDIVVADTATEAEKYAAAEFQTLFAQASGVTLPIVNAPGDRPGHVLIGPDVVPNTPDDLGEEGLRIVIAADRIAITGGRPRGTLYGVYEFFEKYLGVRFLTFDHTHVPALSDAPPIPIGIYSYRPPLVFRDSYYRENRAHPQFATRRRLNTITGDAKLGGMSRQHLISHTFGAQLPTSKYGKDHPEYYALRDGRRLNNVKNDWHESEPCLTNPDVLDIVTEHVLNEIASQPDRRNFSVCQNDNPLYCQCPKCAAIDEREGTPMGSLLTFVNAVAKRVEKKHPDKMIGTLAYWHTRKPPKHLRPRHNVQIQLCSIECCTLHAIDDPHCEKNVAFARDLEGWKKLTDKIYIWNYNTNFAHYDMPFPNLRSIEPNVRFFVRNNARGLFMQANMQSVGGELSDLRNYMISGLLWHPTASGQALRDEFLDLHYGSAAPAIRRYIELIHDNAEAKGVHPACFPAARDVGLDPTVATQAMDLFAEATAAADDDVVRKRVEQASITAYSAMLEAGAAYRFEDGRMKITFPERFGDVVAKYIALTKKYGITHGQETKPIEAYYDVIREAAKGYPVARIENDVWRLTALLSRNGKVVELRHKPSGTDLVDGVASSQCAFGFPDGLDEYAMVGYSHEKPWAFTLKSQDGQSADLIKTLPTGATIERTIRFADNAPEKIQFTTRITHRGQAHHEYQYWVRCDFREPLNVATVKGLQGFGHDGKWQTVADGWYEDEDIAARTLYGPNVDGIALVNPAAKAGVVVRFDAAKTFRPQLALEAISHRADLELLTQRFPLDDGESVEYTYTLEFTPQAPRD